MEKTQLLKKFNEKEFFFGFFLFVCLVNVETNHRKLVIPKGLSPRFIFKKIVANFILIFIPNSKKKEKRKKWQKISKLQIEGIFFFKITCFQNFSNITKLGKEKTTVLLSPIPIILHSQN
jgi:hypothetical protein